MRPQIAHIAKDEISRAARCAFGVGLSRSVTVVKVALIIGASIIIAAWAHGVITRPVAISETVCHPSDMKAAGWKCAIAISPEVGTALCRIPPSPPLPSKGEEGSGNAQKEPILTPPPPSR